MLSEVLQYIQDSSACQQWLRRQADIDSGLSPSVPMTSNSGRRSAPPLNLTSLPGTEKLNEKEKELCQMVRLVPGAYLEYKSALLNECNKQRGLWLAQARALIKIDVNKTRKIWFPHLRRVHHQSLRLPRSVAGQRTARPFWRLVFELKSHCEKRGRTKEIFSFISAYFLLHPALKYSCCWYCAAELCAR